MIRPGEEWGTPSSAPPDLEVAGADGDLAAAIVDRPGVLVRFRPDSSSDLARAVGLDGAGGRGVEVPMDVLRLDAGPNAANTRIAVNMVLFGTPPDALRRFVGRFAATVHVDGRPVFAGPCTTVLVAVGEFRAGLDLVPRGHPGDGRAEIQVYAVPAKERHALRGRLATGTHLPHPRITQRSGARVTVAVDRPVRLEIDGHTAGTTAHADLAVVPAAYRLLL